MISNRAIVGAVFGALFFAACSAPPYPAYSIEDDAEANAAVVVDSASLQDVIRVGKPHLTRAADNTLHVVVPIRNVDDNQIQILAQISFRNKQKEPIEDESNKQVMLLSPGATVDFVSTSRSSAADDFVLRLFWNK
jgi:hypothetical protein